MGRKDLADLYFYLALVHNSLHTSPKEVVVVCLLQLRV